MNVLKSLSDNSKISVISVLASILIVFILVEILLDLVMMRHFQLKSGYFGYYVMRLGNLFNLSVLHDLV